MKAILLAAAFLLLVAVGLELDRRFGRPDDDVDRLVKERKRRESEERDAMDEAAKRLARWRKNLERRALTK